MGIDVTALAISVTSQGISETSQALDKLATSATNVGKALESTQTPQKNLAASQKSSADAAEALLAKMQKQADLLGANTQQSNAYNAALKGANTAQQSAAVFLGNSVDAYKAMSLAQAEAIKMNKQWNEGIALNAKGLRDQELAAKRAAEGVHSFSLVTAGSTRELLVMTHEMETGNFSRFGGSIIVMAERINFVPYAIAKVTAAAEALGVSLAVATGGIILIIGALVGAGAAVLAFVKNSSEVREFNKELILTGNYAGTTGDAMYEMAVKVGSAAGSISSAKEAVSELTKTGKFSAEQIEAITKAAVGLQVYGGVAIKDTVADFVKLAGEPLTGTERSFQRVTKAVLELDAAKHFLSATVLNEIVEAEKSGDVLKAQAIAQKAMEDADTSRIEALKKNLSGFKQITHDVGSWFGKMWEQVTGAETDDAKIERLQKFLATPINEGRTDDGPRRRAMQQKELDGMLSTRAAAQAKATADRVQGVKDENAKVGSLVIEAADKLLRGEETVNEKVNRLRKAFADQHIAGIKGDLDKEEAMIEAYRIRISAKPKAERSEGLTGVNEQIAAIEALNEPKKRAMEYAIKLIDQEAKYKIISAEDAADKKDKILQNENVLFEKYYKEELAIVSAFHGKTKSEENEAASLRSNIIKKLADLEEQSALKKAENMNKLTFAADEQERNAKKAADAFNKSTEKNISDIMAKVFAYRNLSDAQKAQGVTEKQLQDQITLGKINELQMDLLDDTLGQKEIDRINEKIAKMQELIGWQKQLEDEQQKNANILAAPAAQKADANALAAGYKTAGSEIEKALTSAFGKAGKAAGDMFKAYADGAERQIKLTETIAEAEKRKSTDAIGAQKVIDQAQAESSVSQMQQYGDIADAAASFFDKQSGIYKALHALSVAYHAAETILAIKSIAPNIAAGAAKMFSQMGFWGFVGVAAMFGVMASLGASSGGSVQSPEEKQAAAGTGSILGDSTAKSESIAKSLKIMETNSGLGLVDSGEMVESLKTLNNSISGLASVIVQGTTLTGPASATVKTELLGGAMGPKALYDILGLFSSTASNKDSGLQFGKQSLGSVQSSGSLSGSQYSVDEVTKKFIFTYSDKITTSLTALGSDVTNQFGLVINNIAKSVNAAANILGLGGAAFADHLQQFVIDIGQISTKGLTGDQIQKELEAIFSKVGDEMAAFGVAGLQQFEKVGEGYLETLSRVANDLVQVRDVFAVLGQTIKATGTDAIKTSEGLIEAAGDLATLTKNTKYFVTNFESAAEQLAPIQKSVQAAMEALGESTVTTVGQFKNLVLSQDLNTDAGQKMYAALIAIAPQFKQVADAVYGVAAAAKTMTEILQERQGLQDQLDQLTMSSAQLLEKQRNALDASNRSLFDQINILNKAISDAEAWATKAADIATTANSAVDKNMTALTASVNAQKAVIDANYQAQVNAINAQHDLDRQAAQDSLNIATTTASSIKSIYTNLTSTAETLNDMSYKQAQGILASAVASSNTGGSLIGFEGLDTALKSTSKQSEASYKTALDFQRDQQRTANYVNTLVTNSKKEMTAADAAVVALNKLIVDVDSNTKLQLAQAAAQHDGATAQLDAVLKNAQDQVDSLKGIDTNTYTIAQAMAGFTAAISAAKSANLASSQAAVASSAVANAPNLSVTDLYHQILGRAPEAGAVDFWTNIFGPTLDASEVAHFVKSAAPELSQTHYAGSIDGSHVDGLDFVPKDNYRANLHAGERVQTAKAAKDSDNVAHEIRGMRSELNAALISIAQNTGKSAKLQTRWDGDGQPPIRDVV